MRYGFWLPVFGGWLRNVDQEAMEASWEYSKRLAVESESLGFDLTLIAELNLNDIKGPTAPSLDAWSTAAAITAITKSLEIMVAVRPTFHNPALLAKQAANIDHIGGGNRLSLNIVSSCWKDEATQYGIQFEQHDDRYARSEEWINILDKLWKEDDVSYHGRFHQVSHCILQPKPKTKPRPVLYAGGESEAAKDLIARTCDGYLMHGDSPEKIHVRVEDMRRRRETYDLPPLLFGVSAYAIVRDRESEVDAEIARITDVKQSTAGYANYQQWLAGTQLEQHVSLHDYSVSNRGLRSGLTGTPQQIVDQIGRFEQIGIDLILMQSSPQLEEMQRFSQCILAKS